MRFSSDCLFCLLNRQQKQLQQLPVSEEEKGIFLEHLLALLSERASVSSIPQLMPEISKLYWQDLHHSDTPAGMDEQKRRYNQLILDREELLWQEITGAEDPLLRALSLAQVGNYVDFGTLNQVEDTEFLKLLHQAARTPLPSSVYASFRQELENAKTLVYCTDNCGEIGLDKLLIRLMAQQYPHLSITAVVRGEPVLNDATLEDARQVGLDQLVPVVGNGTAIPGTELDCISPAVHTLLTQADLIISKGQGNFETLHGCGLNIYYLFLCKCDYFVRKFQMERFQGVFTKESLLTP